MVSKENKGTSVFTSVDEIHFSIGYIIDTLHITYSVSMITLVFQQEFIVLYAHMLQNSCSLQARPFMNQLSPCSQLEHT